MSSDSALASTMQRVIVAPLDGSAFAEHALPLAVALAQALGAKLTLVRAVEPDEGASGSGSAEQPRAEAVEYLADVAMRVRAEGLTVETVAPQAPASDAILQESLRRQAMLIVMSTQGRSGLGRWLYGSVAEGVLTRTETPVVLIRPGDAPQYVTLRGGTLLVPLDGSAFAETVLGPVTALARVLDASLVVVRASPIMPVPMTGHPVMDTGYAAQQALEIEQAGAEKYVAEVAARLTADGLRVRTRTGVGSPVDLILEEAAASNAALIAMATHGHTGLRSLIMGSVARAVLQRDTRPLLLIRPREATE